MLVSRHVLGTVLVSSGSCVWDLKCSIRKTIPQIRMHMRRMTLMYGSHILVDSALVHDAGIANGAMLSLILTPTHKILVGRGDVAELWNDEGRLHGVLWGHTDDITDVKFSPDTNLAISCSWGGSTKPWEVGSQECLFTLRHQEGAVTGSFIQHDRHHGGDHHSCKCIEVVVRPLGRLHQHAHVPPPRYIRLCLHRPRGQCIYSTQHKIAAPCGT